MLIFIAIAVFLFAAYAILMEYYRKGWDAIPVFKMNSPSAEKAIIKISVIVAVRNEEGNILHLLESLARQSYPKELYQVIVLDDCSNDRTWELMHLFSYENFNAKFIQLSDYAEKLKSASFKKFAIETGISQSTGDLIITTDADCSHHKDWLMAIAAFYQQTNAKFIAAPVKMDTDGSLLSAFQTLDFIALQGITGGSVFKKLHSMCNGANLAYEKKAYYAVNGFKGIDNIPSGDDMLLMYKIYKKYPEGIFFLKNKTAIVSTKPEATLKNFINQRVRWASKADKYDDKRVFWALLLVYIFNLLFPVLLIASFWSAAYFGALIILLLLKTFIEYQFVKTVAAFFEQENLMRFFPLLQPLHIIYTIVVGWLGKFGSYQWKGRKIG